MDREEISLVFFWWNVKIKFISNKSYVDEFRKEYTALGTLGIINIV